MRVETKIEPLGDFIEVALREDLSPQARSAVTAAFARGQLNEAKQRNRAAFGRVPRHTTSVDGHLNAPLESVRPSGGRIDFEFELLDEVLRWIGAALVQRSPVRSGAYVRGHRFFADSVELRPGAPLPPNATEFVFLNLVPYARKIEIGKTRSGRDFVIQVPNRIYERTANDAKRRFGNIALIRFSYRSAHMAYQAAGTAGAHHSRRGGLERSTRAPAIVVTLRG